jgi:hypothetical protein
MSLCHYWKLVGQDSLAIFGAQGGARNPNLGKLEFRTSQAQKPEKVGFLATWEASKWREQETVRGEGVQRPGFSKSPPDEKQGQLPTGSGAAPRCWNYGEPNQPAVCRPRCGPASPLYLQASAHGKHSRRVQVYHNLVPGTADCTTFLELG